MADALVADDRIVALAAEPNPPQPAQPQPRQHKQHKYTYQTTDEERKIIVNLHMTGMGPKKISQQTHVPYTAVRSVLRTFHTFNRIDKLPRHVNVSPWTTQQKDAIVNWQIRHAEWTYKRLQMEFRKQFPGVKVPCKASMHKILKKHPPKPFTEKNLYKVPKGRNTPETIEARYDFATWCTNGQPESNPANLIYIDEAGFNLVRNRTRGRAMLGQRAYLRDLPNSRGANITLVIAVSPVLGLVWSHIRWGSMNQHEFLQFLLYVFQKLSGHEDNSVSSRSYTFIMDNVAFHKTQLIQEFFARFEMTHPQTNVRIKHQVKYLPPYSPFFNIAEYCFSCWKAHARYFQYVNREELTSIVFNTPLHHTSQNISLVDTHPQILWGLFSS